jgi:hypothetical protein
MESSDHSTPKHQQDDEALDRQLLESLPRWALVAFIVRCAQRFLPVYLSDSYEPHDQRLLIANAIRLADKRASIGGDFGFQDALELDGQYFDPYDLESVRAALPGAVQAASNTFDDLVEDDSIAHEHGISISKYTGMILAVSTLAEFAFEAAFGFEFNGMHDRPRDPERPPNLIQLAESASNCSRFGHDSMRSQLLIDLNRIKRRAQLELWNDQTPVSSSQYGPLWASGPPPGWPNAQLSFRPRARIVRTIGDRLISGPEAAVIELIKNSHDADASYVRITFVPPLSHDEGMIIIEDDGHGMTLEDVEQKWMEPATTDKRDRKLSPKGRKLLGSKGIGRFASSRLGRYLELTSSAFLREGKNLEQSDADPSAIQTTCIPKIDWQAFEDAQYLEDVRFSVQILPPEVVTGTRLQISCLRDDWPESRMRALHEELRRVVSPISDPAAAPFKIFLNLSQCTEESCGFDGNAILMLQANSSIFGPEQPSVPIDPQEVRPFPILEACDYSVDGVFDESGSFDGTMTIRRAGQEPQDIRLQVPLSSDDGDVSCGIVLVHLYIFDRDAAAVRTTAEKAGFGRIGVRESRKLLDSIAGVAIYRGGFRIRPYGDSANDWLTLDTKRVQNPTMRIGRNQIAGIVSIDDEASSHLVERSSREGLEENGSFRRLQDLVSRLLSEVVEPKRRQFRISAGFDLKEELSFRDVYHKLQMDWSKLLVAKMPEADREEAQALIARESDRLTTYVKRLEERQARLEAKVTLGLIIGELLHQGNTPLSFIEIETARLLRWWPHLLQDNDPSHLVAAAREPREICHP